MNRATSDRRLLKLADFLEALPRKRFNYDRWVGMDWQGALDLSCGTTACALGWAATMPAFRRAGLILNRDCVGNEVTLKHDPGTYPAAAAAEVFGLLEREAYFLFYPSYPSWSNGERQSPDRNSTPKQVARHIRRFVRERAVAA
jgi:hypothetical protein